MTQERTRLYLLCRAFQDVQSQHIVQSCFYHFAKTKLINQLQIRGKKPTQLFSLFQDIVISLKQWSIYLELFLAKISKVHPSLNCWSPFRSLFVANSFFSLNLVSVIFISFSILFIHTRCSLLPSCPSPLTTPRDFSPIALISLHAFLTLKKENKCLCWAI